MIHALPIFWDHRYNMKSYKSSKSEQEKIDVSDYYSGLKGLENSEPKIYQRDEGETAIEILQPSLFCEPPLSSALCYTSTNIFIMLSKARKKLREEEEQTENIRDRMVYIDAMYLDFYRHHFNFSEKKNVRIIDVLNDFIPLPPFDDIYSQRTDKRRAPLNGFLTDFFYRMYNININVFFDVSDDVVFSKMSRLEVMHEVSAAYSEIRQYGERLNYDTFKDHTLYNIPIHSEFYFGNNEEEEEEGEKPRNRIRVEELDKINTNCKRKVKKTKKRKSIDNGKSKENQNDISNNSTIMVDELQQKEPKNSSKNPNESLKEEEHDPYPSNHSENEPNKNDPKKIKTNP